MVWVQEGLKCEAFPGLPTTTQIVAPGAELCPSSKGSTSLFDEVQSNSNTAFNVESLAFEKARKMTA